MNEAHYWRKRFLADYQEDHGKLSNAMCNLFLSLNEEAFFGISPEQLLDKYLEHETKDKSYED